MRHYPRPSASVLKICALITVIGACGQQDGSTSSPLASVATSVSTVEEFNSTLLPVGVTFDSYHPNFYVGFAPRANDPSLAHVHMGRGNNTRLTVPLTPFVLTNYLSGLVYRHEILSKLKAAGKITLVYADNFSKFSSVIQSSVYNILPTLAAYESGQMSEAEYQAKSLQILQDLNPGRVFHIRMNLVPLFASVQDALKSGGALDLKRAVELTNDMVPGRVNVYDLKGDLLGKFGALQQAASGDANTFAVKAFAYLNAVTQDRLQKLGRCDATKCELDYHEFTSVMPNGSTKSAVSDGEGNTVADRATVGGWNFIRQGGGSRPADKVEEGHAYYGWAPKMDYQPSGNAFHNAAVQLPSRDGSLGDVLRGVSNLENKVWVVSRGPVSHGCSRLSEGGIWEMRHVFPANHQMITEITAFLNDPRHYDVFDINGDGAPEVMGVKYFVAYRTAGTSGDAYRRSAGADPESFNRTAFYHKLYGSRGPAGQQFTIGSGTNGEVRFSQIKASLFLRNASNAGPSFSPSAARATTYASDVYRDIPLYEQEYEREKVQFFALRSGTKSTFDMILGRLDRCPKRVPADLAGEFAKFCYDSTLSSEIRSILGVEP